MLLTRPRTALAILTVISLALLLYTVGAPTSAAADVNAPGPPRGRTH